MHRLWVAALLALATHTAQAAEIETPAGVVTVALPEALAEMPDEDVQSKYGKRTGRLPAKVFANQSRGTSVAIDWFQWSINEQGDRPLLTLLAKYSEAFPKLAPGLVWLRKETIEIAGREWLHLEFTIPLREALVFNSYYAAVTGEQVVLLNVSVAEPERSLFAEGSSKLRESLRLR